MIPGSANPLLLATAAGAGGGYAIERSLRFNSADSAYLNRTPASAGNRKTWTWSGWVKFSADTGYVYLLNCENTDRFYLLAQSGNLTLTGTGASIMSVRPNGVFRDPSAWYHVAISIDTTQSTDSDRVKIYVNGEERGYSVATYPSLNADLEWNTATAHEIVSRNGGSFGGIDVYLADIHFIDGQALDPTSFGEFDTNGIWQPKAFAGSYGTNGFHLDFADNSTTAALGTDTSGNGNTWTVNNLSVTAGAGNDSLVDVPTNGTETDTGAGGEVRGNYCTLNPLDISAAGGTVTLSNGNLQYAGVNTSAGVKATIFPSSGKWYWESTLDSGATAAGTGFGDTASIYFPGFSANSYSYESTGQTRTNGVTAAYGATYTTGDIIGTALDLDAGTVVFYKNGSSQGTAFTGISGAFAPQVGDSGFSNSTTWIVNFGQRPFAYTAPSGFKALCTANLPAPLVTKPSEYMDVALYTGNNTARSITGLAFNPDLVWIKGRSGATDHALYDIVRGVEKDLVSNSTAAETTQTTGLTAFNSDGFSIGTLAKLNTNAATYAAWTWDAGSSTVSNDAGSITSQVRANASAGFSIVTYTGTGASATVGHGLGVRPVFMIIKNRSASGNWTVLSDWTYPGNSVANSWANRRLKLNTTDAYDGSLAWNDATIPTSSVFYLGSPSDVNGSGNSMVAYCFAPVEGYSAFGSYTGNGSTDGPFVYTGFRPAFVIIKITSTTSHWVMFDSKRSGYNAQSNSLSPSSNEYEDFYVATPSLDLLSNGFKFRSTSGYINFSGATYIYAAFAENPFALNARAR
jgi:hypothetical protein